MSRLTQADLERALGGAQVLVELLDFDGDGVADATSVSEILVEADEEANSYIGETVNVSDATVATAPLLLMREKACAVYLVWLRGTRSQAMPDAVRQARLDAIEWYKDVRDRRAGLGTTTKPATAQFVEQVTLQPSDTLVSQSSPRQRFRGMW